MNNTKKSFGQRAALTMAAMLTTGAMAATPGGTFVSTSATLALSTSSLQTLSIAGVTVSAIAPSTYNAGVVGLSQVGGTGLSWSDSLQLQQVYLPSDGFMLTSSTVPGAKIKLTNVSFDLTNNTVYLDAQTSSWNNPPIGTYTGQTVTKLAMFTGDFVGQSSLAAYTPGADGTIVTATNLKNLKLTAQAIPLLGNALGVPTSLQQILFPTLNFGDASAQSVIRLGTSTPAVPELSTLTYQVMGLGLLGMAAGFKRRKAAR